MSSSGTVTPSDQADQAMDLTQEAPVVDGIEESPRRAGVRSHNLIVIAVVVVVIGGATGLTLWLTGGSPAPGLVVTPEVVKVTTANMDSTAASSERSKQP